MVKNKYHNKSVTIDGIRFASTSESRRYLELKLLKQAGEIKDFILQPPFVLQEAFRKCPSCNHIQDHVKGSQKKKDILCHECGEKTNIINQIEYIADFLIINNDGTERIEDTKGSRGFLDPVFKLKYKLFESRYPDKTINIVIMSGRKR
jgi:hypothetical protein